MASLPEFLLARIAEDERIARIVQRSSLGADGPLRGLLGCEAKRRIVERFAWTDDLTYLDADSFNGYATLCDLAAMYADHPDYDEFWRA